MVILIGKFMFIKKMTEISCQIDNIFSFCVRLMKNNQLAIKPRHKMHLFDLTFLKFESFLTILEPEIPTFMDEHTNDAAIVFSLPFDIPLLTDHRELFVKVSVGI